MSIAALAVAAAEEGFEPPGPGDFELPAILLGVTKPMVLLVLSAALVLGFFVLASRERAMVPGRLQFAGEQAYGFVRNGIARDIIGSRDYMRYVPYLVALFFFVLLNNLFGIIPFIQFPTFSRAGFVYGLAGLTWLLYNGSGIARHGFFGFYKHMSVPSGIEGPILGLIVPLEFISNIVVRPFTLALRLFANMFAGHLLLILFSLGGEYLLFESGNLFYAPVGVVSFLLGIAIGFLEILVQFLQAYVFTLLTAMYVSEALAEEH